MSRGASSAQQRTLTLTEELEKLEQSITLTLQEIDHNFSKAHRIVTSSILPIVEQYAVHSKDVWEGSKFWKQFFESSANVSLSGYEEQPSAQDDFEDSAEEASDATTHTTLDTSSYETPSAQHISTDSVQDIDQSNLTASPSQSTPRATIKAKAPHPGPTMAFADYPSAYEKLRQEVSMDPNSSGLSNTQGDDPETPGKSAAIVNESRNISMTPGSSPFLPQNPSSIPRPSAARQKTDPLLHRVLDRNYRIQATPLTSNRFANFKLTNATTPATAARTRLLESTLSSSPEIAAPELHAEIFSSPDRRARPKGSRTPGLSVLTPAKSKFLARQPEAQGTWDSDDEFDDDDNFGQSPPKTMQFHIPQSRLLKTPAKEASKRIVEDLLNTAGLGTSVGRIREYDDEEDFTDEIAPQDNTRGFDENSPSVVRKVQGFEDESF